MVSSPGHCGRRVPQRLAAPVIAPVLHAWLQDISVVRACMHARLTCTTRCDLYMLSCLLRWVTSGIHTGVSFTPPTLECLLAQASTGQKEWRLEMPYLRVSRRMPLGALAQYVAAQVRAPDLARVDLFCRDTLLQPPDSSVRFLPSCAWESNFEMRSSSNSVRPASSRCLLSR